MSKLDELIKELCPDGVEYKTLGEVCEMQRGTSLTRANSVEGEYPVISGGKEPAFYCNQFNRDGETITVAGSGAGAGFVQYWNEKIFVCDAFSVKGKELLKTKFVYHCLSNLQEKIYATKKGGGVPHVHISSVENFHIPIPPLPVQEEIVRVLDKFTSLTAELTAELTARRKQYEYYRDALLTRDTKIEQTTLDKISENCDSQRKPVTSGNRIKGDYPYYGASGIVDYVNDYIFDGDYLLVSEDGANLVARSTPIAFSISGKNWVNNHAHILKFKESATRKFVEHYLNSINLEKYISGGAQPKLNQQNLNKIPIPLPPLSVQQRIVDVLDNFDAICSDLKIGLPAEIDARKKQYEYYRDLLLTFAERGNTIFADSRQQTADSRQQTADSRQQTADEIKLLQYVFGYVVVQLGDVATITRGGNFQKKDFTEDGIPCIHYGQMYTHFGVWADKTLTFVSKEMFEKSKQAQPNDIIMAVTSENVEDVCKCTAWVGNVPVAVSGHTAIIHHNQNAKFLSYYFHSSNFFEQKKKLAHGTKVIEVTPSALAEIKIPLPPLSEQERIVSILDRFDELVASTGSATGGIPAEIEARQKQYEYYRDKLLMFKEK